MAEADIKDKRMLKLPAIVITRISLLFAALSLAACGGSSGSGSSGGGSGPAPNLGNDPGTGTETVSTGVKPGIFTTAITYDSGASSQPGLALLSSTGEYAIFATKAQTGTFGTLTFPGDDTFSDENGTYVFLDETWQSVTGSLEGGADSLEQFTATFTANSAGPDVSFDMIGERFNDLSELQWTIEDLSGIYSLSGTNPTTITIQADGRVEGSEISGPDPDQGCVISGEIAIPDSTYNLFEGLLKFENCASISSATSEQRNGDYQVVGFLVVSEEFGKELVFAGTNGEVRTVFMGSNR